jgi:hypothetical protein
MIGALLVSWNLDVTIGCTYRPVSDGEINACVISVVKILECGHLEIEKEIEEKQSLC